MAQIGHLLIPILRTQPCEVTLSNLCASGVVK